MHTDAKELVELADRLRELHSEFSAKLADVSAGLRGRQYKPADLVDVGFLCHEAEMLLDDWRKDCKARRELASKLTALEVMQGADTVNGLADDTVEGALASGRCNLKMIAELPKRGTTEFMRFLSHFGVPEAAIDSGVIKIDFKGTAAHVTQCAEAGKPVPPGIGKQYPEYTTTYRRKRT